MKTFKHHLFLVLATGLFFSSCDKIEKIYEPKTYNTDLNISLYPGSWENYLANEWPNFDQITASTDRNILIDDFTGHNCAYCPPAANVAHNLVEQNHGRVFVSSIHSSPTGITGFQAVNAQYPVDFTNPDGIALGKYFGQTISSGFTSNPALSCSRIVSSGDLVYQTGTLNNLIGPALSSALKVKIKSKCNYYQQTNGAFLHTEIEVLDNSLGSLGTVVVLQQDSLIAPQNVLSTFTPNYVHRDIHRGNISNSLWGVTLTDDLRKENGKYYLDYSFVLPPVLTLDGSELYDAGNLHVLVYVYDKETFEIYQVVKEKFIP